MTKINTNICILGGGPAALFCHSFLKDKEIDIINVAENLYGLILPVNINGLNFNITPNFPVRNSNLARLIEQFLSFHFNIVNVKYKSLNLAETNTLLNKDYSTDSYVDFLLKSNLEINLNLSLLLSIKLFGSRIFVDPLNELRRKIERHYSSRNLKKERLGFKDGLSPYYLYLYIKNEDRINSICENVRSIVLKKQIIVTDSFEIRYEKLISTIPLPKFLKLYDSNLEISFEAEGAKFYLFYTEEDIEPNNLIYDCKVDSCIYRVFIPRGNIIVTQVSNNFSAMDMNIVKERVKYLLGLSKMPNYLNLLHLQNCYPLDTVDKILRQKVETQLRENKIWLFGRFGRWEYTDLHELNWNILDEII